MKEFPKLVHVHGMVNLMRGLQPPTWAEKPVTDEELALLGLSRDEYEKLK